MRFLLDRKVVHVGRCLPLPMLRSFLRASVGRRHVALALHRVRGPVPGDADAELSIQAKDLDDVIDLLLAMCPGRTERWLTVTFDDGYDDAAAYVESRASRFPGVDFILFVCGEKCERGVGFRWDLAELSRQAGEPPERATEIFEAPLDVETENEREDLRRVASDSRFRLAGVGRLRSLATRPNVFIGNHTNCHFELSELRPAQARLELERSHASFERLFGRQRHFAFPFGYGFFDESHVRLLRSLGDSIVWGTGQSTLAPAGLDEGAVRPRVVIDGPWGVRGIVAVVAARDLATRILGARAVARHTYGRAHRQGVR